MITGTFAAHEIVDLVRVVTLKEAGEWLNRVYERAMSSVQLEIIIAEGMESLRRSEMPE